MKFIPNLRTTRRRQGKGGNNGRRKRRVGSQPVSWISYVQVRPDGSACVPLPHAVSVSLLLRRGQRVWWYRDKEGVRITIHPWGPRNTRRISNRVRLLHVPFRNQVRRARRQPIRPG